MGRIKKEAGGRDYCWMVLTHFLINQTNCQTTQCRYKHKQTAVWATCSKLVDQGKLKSCVTMVTGFFFFFLQRVICDYAFKNMLKTRLQFKKKKMLCLVCSRHKKGREKSTSPLGTCLFQEVLVQLFGPHYNTKKKNRIEQFKCESTPRIIATVYHCTTVQTSSVIV